jgi:hypothetical protein
MDPDKIIEKTIEEGAKQTIGKMVDGVSSLLSLICKPAAEEFGLYLSAYSGENCHLFRK